MTTSVPMFAPLGDDEKLLGLQVGKEEARRRERQAQAAQIWEAAVPIKGTPAER